MYKRVKLWLLLGGLLLPLLILAACQGPTIAPTPVPTAEASRIAISISTFNNPYFIAVEDGAQEAANRLGVDLILLNAQNQSERQNEQLEALIADGVDALLINPVDGGAIVDVVLQANEAGIPVFTVDRRAAGGEVVSHIASDNVAGGEMAAAYVADLLGGEGKVVEIRGVQGTSASHDRGQGFRQGLADYPGIEVVFSADADFDKYTAEQVMAGILDRREQIDAVFAHNDQMILGAIEAAQDAGRAEEIQFVGFDGIGDAVAAIERGELNATIAQQPAEMGRLAVELAVEYLRSGESLPTFTPVDLALIAE